MMIRIFALLLISAGLCARASDPIPAPQVGNSASVTQPHVVAELIPDYGAIKAGKPFDVALHLHADPGWHTYWINPGDAGLATTIKWTLPPGYTAGPIQWPPPEKHNMGPLVTYGYAGDVYLLTTITPPANRDKWPVDAEIKALARWLVCQEECIPGKAELSFRLNGGSTPAAQAEDGVREKFFAAARDRMPVENTLWNVSADYTATGETSGNSASGRAVLELGFESKNGSSTPIPVNAYFYLEQSNVVSPKPAEIVVSSDKGFILHIDQAQNGDHPAQLSGVLVSDIPLIGSAKAVYISQFTLLNGSSQKTEQNNQLVAAAVPSGGAVAVSFDGDAEPPLGTAAATNGTEPSPGGRRLPEAPPLLIAVLGAAFIGGLILNLMPCVLPVLSLKVFSLIKHSGDDPRGAWKQGVAFTVGVVISFWVLAGLLLALRAAGNQLGWGFQMQSPGFVLGLIFLFFLLGLNLFGVFELGTSLVGLDAKTTGRTHGLTSSFLNGALATLAATPCTAPFMGSALGFAAQQPANISLLIFTFLAFGMATPYLLLTIFPGALRFVPKPGAWMEAFKQFMGFLLMGTVIFLVYVFGALVGQEQVPWLLAALLLAGLAAWIYGRWGTPTRSMSVRITAFILALGLMGFAIDWGVRLAQTPPPAARDSGGYLGSATAISDGFQPWSQSAVDAALAQGRPVFVDFTAAWCLSCKVNERVALDTDAVKQAFAEKNVALFKADWTHADPEISKTLQLFKRDGVPLYLLYSPKAKDAPQVLPEVLTPGIVLDAVKNL